MSKINYFANKEELKKRANQWTNYMENNYKVDIDNSVQNTIIYPLGFELDDINPRFEWTDFIFLKMDSVSAIFEVSNTNDKVCVLNFASYKNPGGKFMEGSSAQEESLCHESFLYNVLRRFDKEYYLPNKKDVNDSLYRDNLLYSKFILFFKPTLITPCDVITCAAPNKTAAVKYHGISEDVVNEHMMSRLNHVLQAAYDQKVDTLILGAYGCGVFGNNPKDVANMMYILLNSTYKNCFKKVIFAIPEFSKKDKTFTIFKEAFNKYDNIERNIV